MTRQLSRVTGSIDSSIKPFISNLNGWLRRRFLNLQGTDDTEVEGPVPGDAAVALHAAAKLVQRLTSSQRIMQVCAPPSLWRTTWVWLDKSINVEDC